MDVMNILQMTAREALERLPERIKIARGALRIRAHFSDGKLLNARFTAFRVPAAEVHAIEGVLLERGPIDGALLEHAVRELGLDSGEIELVVEYEQYGDGLKLHWLDVGWDAT